MLVMGQAWWSQRPATIPMLGLVGPVEGLDPSTEAILLHGTWHIRMVARAIQPLGERTGVQRNTLTALRTNIDRHLVRGSDRQVAQSERLLEVELATNAALEAIAELRQQASPRVQRTLDRLSRRLKATEGVISRWRRRSPAYWAFSEFGDDQGGPQISLETARVAALTAIEWLWPWSNEIATEAAALRNQVDRSRTTTAADAASILVSVLLRISELATSASMTDDKSLQRSGLHQCVNFVIRWLRAPPIRSLPRRDEGGPPVKARLIKSSIRRRRR